MKSNYKAEKKCHLIKISYNLGRKHCLMKPSRRMDKELKSKHCKKKRWLIKLNDSLEKKHCLII